MPTLSEAADTLGPGAADLIELGNVVNRGIADIRGHLENGGTDAAVDITSEFATARTALNATKAAVRAIRVKIATAINA